jgi:hypothetical protein
MSDVEHGLRDVQVGDMRAQVRELHLRDDYEGMLTGTPWLHRRFRLRYFDKQLAETTGLYIHDLDNIRADSASKVETWLPRIRAHARLTAYWQPADIAEDGRTVLSVVWYQNPGEDPFTRLTEIVRPLNWAALARFEPA